VRQSSDVIEVLEEILGSLRITEENISSKTTEPAISEISEEILTVPVEYHKTAQAVMSKSMVPDSEWCQDYRKWTLFFFFSHFYFIFDLFFIFSIFRTLGLGSEVIGHISHI